MAFQVPIGRVQGLPDTIEVRMPRNRRRAIQLLRVRGAGEQYGRRRRDRADDSIVQSKSPLSILHPGVTADRPLF